MREKRRKNTQSFNSLKAEIIKISETTERKRVQHRRVRDPELRRFMNVDIRPERQESKKQP